ncbi:pyridoxamine 5'-phosphate oxidase family protein [Nocardioides plantarum]|uniref:Pyridoxamine 5'-phosphate oxidase family protein n=1 Tax=Nocardioides plantarum TaxID=29299 RepID=A0ABV5K9G2_9ACTN|nr:pyridoxamine 5'-phosphate oxidase family protein [Nocardioides plantarum]
MSQERVDHLLTSHRHEMPGRLVELDVDECWELLRRTPVGRLAWNGAAGPTVVPVNYVATSDGIVVKTTAYSAAVRETDDSPITFQVDHIDPETRTGWSVLAHGRLDVDWSFGRVDAPEVDVWPAGPRPLRLQLEISTISGRRLTD